MRCGIFYFKLILKKNKEMSEYDNKSVAIRFWAEEDQPREKLITKGRHVLSDSELLAIIIGTGTKEQSAIAIAQKLLSTVDNNLYSLAKLSINELQKIKGIGQAKAVNIIAALEIGRRRREHIPIELPKILSSKDVYAQLEYLFRDLEYEEFWVLYLNRSNRIISKKCLSKGGISGTVADIRMIMKEAIETLASGMVLSHNHPSGNLIPSKEDIALTQKCKDACSMLDIKLLDHIIIHENNYYSFSDNGTL